MRDLFCGRHCQENKKATIKEEIFANEISDNGSVVRLHKEISKPNNKENKSMGERPTRNFTTKVM